MKFVFRKFAAFLLLFYFPLEVRAYDYQYYSDGYFSSIHVLTINPKDHVIVPVRANGTEITRETVSTLAKRHGAIAAINGGFWKTNGDPAGILKIDGTWLGTPVKPRGAIGWTHDADTVLIDRVLTSCNLAECQGDIEVIPQLEPQVTTSQEWKGVDHIVGGTPVLISKGNLIEDYLPEKTILTFLTNRHPRTAIGIKDNGEWVLVVVDGRFYQLFGGMTIPELAEFMLQQGCIEALNLDGGGSSTLFLEGNVINFPCGEIYEEGKYVNAVSDAILILEKDSTS